MVKKLTKHGNSLAILIDKPILELLNITEDTRINLRTDGTNIIIEPVREYPPIRTISDNPKLQKVYEELIEKYDDVLRKLAEH
jgi:antitoxin component of MazEF toxin-antitoxin module